MTTLIHRAASRAWLVPLALCLACPRYDATAFRLQGPRASNWTNMQVAVDADSFRRNLAPSWIAGAQDLKKTGMGSAVDTLTPQQLLVLGYLNGTVDQLAVVLTREVTLGFPSPRVATDPQTRAILELTSASNDVSVWGMVAGAFLLTLPNVFGLPMATEHVVVDLRMTIVDQTGTILKDVHGSGQGYVKEGYWYYPVSIASFGSEGYRAALTASCMDALAQIFKQLDQRGGVS